MKLTLYQRSFLLFGAGVFIIIVLSILFILSSEKYFESLKTLQNSHQIINRSELILSLLKDIETGERGYIISQDTHFLEPYEAGRKEIGHHINHLDKITGSDSAQTNLFGQLKPLIALQLKHTKEIVDLIHENRQDEAIVMVKDGYVKEVMDSIRRQISKIKEHERDKLSNYNRTFNLQLRAVFIIVILTLIFTLIFMTLAYTKVLKVIKTKEILENEVSRKNHALTEANKEISAINEELTASNEELKSIMEEVHLTNERLHELNNELENRVKERTKELFASNERYELISGLTNDIIWDRFFWEDRVKFNKSFREIFGPIENEIEADTYHTWFNRLHPEDRNKVGNTLDKTIKQKKSSWLIEYRFLRGDGSFAYILDRGIVLYDEDQKPYRILGIIMDISKLKESELSLKEKNSELQATEEELRATNEDLKRTIKELDERNFELDQFVYKISHDLRSPLTSIMGLIELVKDETQIDKIRDYNDLVKNRVYKLDHFIRNMLDYSRNNRTDITPTLIDFEKIIAGNIEELEYVKDFSNLKVNVEINKKANFISDSLRLKIIFNNLLSNAYKYQDTFKKLSYLSISIYQDEEKAEIILKDNGIGIRKEHLSRIFEMFFRASERSDGSGLGLYILKQAVERLKGNISIESKAGEGTNICIVLPNLAKSQPITLKNEIG